VTTEIEFVSNVKFATNTTISLVAWPVIPYTQHRFRYKDFCPNHMAG
jgi:hypothetical protein